MKKCPYCAEEVRDEAVRCRFCGSDLTEETVYLADPTVRVSSRRMSFGPRDYNTADVHSAALRSVMPPRFLWGGTLASSGGLMLFITLLDFQTTGDTHYALGVSGLILFILGLCFFVGAPRKLHTLQLGIGGASFDVYETSSETYAQKVLSCVQRALEHQRRQ